VARAVLYEDGRGDPPVPVGEAIRVDDLKDGPGNTILFSENLQARNWHRIRIGEGASAAALLSSGAPDLVPYQFESRYVQGFVWHFENNNSNVQSISGCAPVTPVHKINGSLGADDKFGIVMDGTNMPAVARPSSAHSGGVNAGFADGSSRFIVETIDYEVYQALMTPRGKSSNVPFPEYVLQGEAL
jgi:prepilin-type processing-associated H-X9-DG protein